MKIVKKMGYGLLSIMTLFFTNISNGFPKSKIVSSINSKIENILPGNGGSAPENLILQQANQSFSDEIINNASHTSHASHKSHASHASHSSGTTGRVVSRPATTKPTPSPTAKTNPYVQLLTTADVEMISGIQGLQLSVEPAILHFLQSDGKEILRIKISGKDNINTYKSDSKYSSISGVGETAFVGTLQLPMQLLFTRGKYCVEIMTFPKEGLNMYLNLEQMKIAANFISSRLFD